MQILYKYFYGAVANGLVKESELKSKIVPFIRVNI